MQNNYPKHIREEMDALTEKYFSTDEDEDLEEFLEENASEEYRKYFSKKEGKDKRLLKKGIIVN